MSWIVVSAWIVVGAALGACTSEPVVEERAVEESSSGDEELPPPEEQLPVEALRPEDAIGFAQMDPSREEDECMLDDELGVAPNAWRISETRTLVWLPCQRGAYQVTGAVFLVGDDGETERLALPYPHPTGDMLSELQTGELTYDPSTRIAVDTIRYRGLGDCGRQLRYEVGSIGLTLIEHREKPCDDEPGEGGPSTWPVVYPRNEPGTNR